MKSTRCRKSNITFENKKGVRGGKGHCLSQPVQADSSPPDSQHSDQSYKEYLILLQKLGESENQLLSLVSKKGQLSLTICCIV